ncbi:uncharacterized protein I303_103756 [Kwoniella dejecticola CBS 10117]|uniref:Uncharacterized protein n=1 Tax=Kwoniella dejecticola CBS 10117 TaxID=1296121 RepID=A0A1A6A7M2_9TREE|nr:uncharacterized protein I303_03773 [Kwoniella dejecticola CBS 10117]OBR86055.1 hypothetical protein I303_03773 [Kwoniella dejecticola CBS 10117]
MSSPPSSPEPMDIDEPYPLYFYSTHRADTPSKNLDGSLTFKAEPEGPNNLLNIQDDLASDISSLAIDWKPLNPDIVSYTNHSESCYPLPLQLYRPALTSQPDRDICISPSPSSSYVLDDRPVDPSNYIIPTTHIPEDRSKYLDPRIPTDVFWDFVDQRNFARSEERKERRRFMMDSYGYSYSLNSDYSPFGGGTPTSYYSPSPYRFRLDDDEDGTDEWGSLNPIRWPDMARRSTFPGPGPSEYSLYNDRMSFAGVELIDSNFVKYRFTTKDEYEDGDANSQVSGMTSTSKSTSKSKSKTKKRRTARVNPKAFKRLVRSTEQYNKDKAKVDEAKRQRYRKINDLALYCATISDKRNKKGVELMSRLSAAGDRERKRIGWK